MNATSKFQSMRIDWQDGLAIVSLAQPARGNPFDGTFTREFKEVFAELWNSEGLRAVLLRADGSNFSFGGDLKEFAPVLDQLGPLVRKWTSDLHMGLQRAWHLPVPIVCAVQGYAMGGGVAVLAGCDVVLAGASSKFGSAFAHIGYSCDSGSSITLTARMGPARARRFVMLGEVLDANEAVASGLADRVVPDAELQDEALKLALKLAQGPTQAYAATKRLFLNAGWARLESQLEDEAITLSRIATTADAREGITSMVEKRKPRFVGR